MKFNFFTKKITNTPSLEIIKTWEEDESRNSAFFAAGAVVHVRNGKGVLRTVWGETDNKTYMTLMYGNVPLLEMQGDEYFCPTCEKIIRSGYGETGEIPGFKLDKINRSVNEVGFNEALEEIYPLLGLMKDGYYIVIDTLLHPTDGNGHFFWNVPGSLVEITDFSGTCLYQFDDFEWGRLRPYFMVGTQSQGRCNMERVEYYREHPGSRAIAYYLDGYMTALIDGHHKAFAAALDKKDVNALVIVPMHMYWGATGKNGHYYEPGLTGCGIKFTYEDINIAPERAEKEFRGNCVIEKITADELSQIRTTIIKNNQKQELPIDTDDIAGGYPSVEEQAYIDRAGKITDEMLDDILSKKLLYNEKQAEILIMALGGLRHKRLFEMGDFFLRQNYCGATIFCVIEQMMKCDRTEELETYFIDVMVEFEEQYPYVKGLILGYL